MSTPRRVLLVTVAGPARATDLAVTSDVPVRELLPAFAALVVHGDPSVPPDPTAADTWELHTADDVPLPDTATLGDAGILDGHVLTVHPRRQEPPR